MRSPSKPFAHQGGAIVLAHRGFSGRFPENTMLAFEKAAELPIDGLEMDIYATKDDVLVISHDDSVARMTNGDGRIQEYTLAELKKLDAGYRFSPDGGQTYPFREQGITIPTMEEVLERFTDLWINVDIKQHEPRIVRLFCDLIRRHNAEKQLCVGSFSSETVAQFRDACPEVTTLASRSEIFQLYSLHFFHLSQLFGRGGHAMQLPPQQKTRLGITFDLASARFLEAAHRHDMALHLWTINNKAEVKRFVDLGIDGIITDYPDRALEALDRLPKQTAAR